MSSSQVRSPFEQKEEAVTQTSVVLPTISHRALLSLRESAKVIGTKGHTIQRSREVNHVKIGLSEKQPGCSDRVLSCAGTIGNVANALGDMVDTLNDRDNDVGNSAEGEKFSFHFLNHILPAPSRDEIKDAEQLKNIGTLRLLVTNSQLSSIIGRGGIKIKSLIEKHGVKIVASRDFLPDSDERVLEMQGFPGSITSALIEISEILLNEMDIAFASERRYYPHLRKSNLSERGSRSSEHVGGSREAEVERSAVPSQEYKAIVNIPEAYVGAIVGRQGNRIANLRKYTKTKILVEKRSESDQPTESQQARTFTIISDHQKNVKLAESMLLKNLSVEIGKREARIRSASSEALQH